MQRVLVYLLLALLVPVAGHAVSLEDALEPLLEGEFALQQGEPGAAAQAYARAAMASADPIVAERAVQVALAAENADLAHRVLRRWAELAPDAEGLAAGRLRLAMLEDRVDDARPALAKLLTRKDGWRPAAAALLAADRRELAASLLGERLDSGQMPAELDAWLAFGGVALRLKDKTLYARLAQAAAVRFPDAPSARIWEAEDLLARDDKAGARKVLDAIAVLPALTPADRLAVAAHLNALGDPAAAAATLADAGDDERVLSARAVYLSEAKDKAGLAALYADTVARTPENEASPARLMLLGQLAEMREDAPAALGWYRRVPTGLAREQAQLRIAILLDKTGDTAAAQDLLREVQASDSEWGDIVRDAYLIEAELARQRGDGQTELSALDRGLSIFDEDVGLRYNRALALERMDRVDEAVADLRLLVADEPEEADWLNALGYTLVDRTAAIQEGFELIERALALKPDSAAIKDSLGWALHRLGRNAEALPRLREAFETQRDAEVATHLASVLVALGRFDEARSLVRLAREMDPDNRALKRALAGFPAEIGAP